ncbi:MAG: glycosyltransferase [Bacteroidota bacterium]
MHAGIDNVDIIYFGLFPWDNPYSSVSLSFTRAFAKRNRVFYINPPFTAKEIVQQIGTKAVRTRLVDQVLRKTRYEKIPNLPSNVIAVHPPAILPINFLPKGNLYDNLHHWNNEVVYHTIAQVIEKYQLKNYIYLNCFNPFVGGVLPKNFRPLLNIYQCIDDMTQEDYTAKHWASLEDQVIKEADLVFVTSKKLHQLKSPLNPQTHILHNAVDENIFRRTLEVVYPKPEEIEHIETPIIGFTGNMDASRIDYPLLKAIAETHKDKTLVLVGPTNNEEYKEIGLDKLPNVIFTGRKDINELPQYLQHFDCTIIPFLKNELTASIYPLKINEYLFSGRPVISTNFSEDIRSFKSVVHLADDHAAFVQQIDSALEDNDADKIQARVNTARSNTWTHRVEEFWSVVNRHLEREKKYISKSRMNIKKSQGFGERISK